MIVVPQVAFRATQVALGEELPPVRVVRDLVARGATEISVLDLDGTLADDVLPQWTEALVAVAGVPLRFDGQLHEGSRIERLARAGFASVVVDQVAVFDPMVLRWALDVFGARLVVQVQVDGEYVFDPPPAAFDRELADVVGDLHFQGVRRLLYRDVGGAVVPTQRLLDLAGRMPGARLTYQGAIRDVDAIAELAMVGPAVEAVLVDAARFIDGDIDLHEAMQAASTA